MRTKKPEDTPEDFQERVRAVAESLGISFPLEEKELRVKKIVFTFLDCSKKTIWADESNKASRAFLEGIARNDERKLLHRNTKLLDLFEEFYGYYWRDEPETDKHAFVDLVRRARTIDYDTIFDTLNEPQQIIEGAWENRAHIGLDTEGEIRDAVNHAIGLLDRGAARVAELGVNGWSTNQWLKKAVLLSFRLNDNVVVESGDVTYFDKVRLKFAGWSEARFRTAGFRAVPGSFVREGAHIGKYVVLMPSFVNIGAFVGEGTMVDAWATVGSCAQIGKNCHISGGAGIGGVLEPLQRDPVIIEDGVFVGARAEVVEGVHVGEGAVISMGVFIGASTKIIDRATGKIYRGYVPPYSVVVPGSIGGGRRFFGLFGRREPALYCAVIVKTVDAQTRAKTEINELLRY